MTDTITVEKRIYIDTPGGRVMVTVEPDGSRWVSLDDYKRLMDNPITNTAFLPLVYSMAKQFISFYEREVKK